MSTVLFASEATNKLSFPESLFTDPAGTLTYVGLGALLGGVAAWLFRLSKSWAETRKAIAETAKLRAEKNKIEAEVQEFEHKAKNAELENNKLREDIAKLRIDQIAKAGEHLEKAQKARDACEVAFSVCRESAEQLRDALISLAGSNAGTSHETPITAFRRKLCCAICEKALPEFAKECEWEALSATFDAGRLRLFLRSVVIPRLEDMSRWVGIANHPQLLIRTDGQRLRVSPETLYPFRSLPDKLPTDEHRNAVANELEKAAVRLMEA